MDRSVRRTPSVLRPRTSYARSSQHARVEPGKTEPLPTSELPSPEDLALESSFPELPFGAWPIEADAETWEPGAWWAGSQPIPPKMEALKAALGRISRQKARRP
jgi:hypothetical protein